MATLARKMFISGPAGATLKADYAKKVRAMYRAVAADIKAVPRVHITVEATAQLIFDVPGKGLFIRVTHFEEMYELTGDRSDRKWWVGVVDAETGEDLDYTMHGANADTATIARKADALYRKVSQ